ncbi:dephospho-CoA kinase [Rufibacter glacialis]|uniref:Dephospho-CoA kinase n=1 Tax=Rufibacter glacialis TaxID=1259555 RepID=A0A5M8QEN2_9BACT|nr:dephospho-CoA kinase [Rufibacter glacialis]KAA6433443.1 dephospho-CoA kinase [Rufibacter glacialis]GGK74141.1 dephospho-CoA kinase [Rufibacter glacialis]
MLKIGITGGIGSGKSIVCKCFQLLGVPVYDSDSRAKWVMNHDPELRAQLITAFGLETFDAQQHLNRTYLSQKVFHNAQELAKLNGLVHPQVRKDFYQWVAQQQTPYILKEAALMFESSAYTQVDHVLTVSAPQALRQTRTLQRDPHRTPAEVEAIMAKQLPEEERVHRSQFVLYNDDAQLVLPQVVKLHETFLRLASEKDAS